MNPSLRAIGLLILAGPAAAEPVIYTIDPTHAIVAFEVKHLVNSTTRGLMRTKEGSVTLDRRAKTGKVNVVIDMSTFQTAVPQQAEFLRGEALLNVAAHPTATFEGDQFSFEGDKLASVAGQMTIAGKTQPVTLKATTFGCGQHPLVKREYCGGDFEVVIQRSQFGLTQLANIASDEVRMLIQVEAIRPQ